MASKNKNWEYAPSLESTEHIMLKKRYDLFINGKWVKTKSNKYFKTINPNDEKVIAEISHANQKDVDVLLMLPEKHILMCGLRCLLMKEVNTYIE